MMFYRPWTRADELATIGLGVLCVIVLVAIIYFGTHT